MAFAWGTLHVKLNKQRDHIQPCHTLLPVLNQSAVPYPVLIVASWPEYRFLRRQILSYEGSPASGPTSILILPATSLNHTGPGTRKLGTGSTFQSPLKWFKIANSRPADPASLIPSQGNHDRGYSFRSLPCPRLPYILWHLWPVLSHVPPSLGNCEK